MIDDPFASVSDSTPDPRIITGGRYRLPRLDGSHKPNGWMRVSNLVSAYADQYALRQWEQRQMMLAVRADHALYTALLEATGDQLADPHWDEEFLERCKKVAGGSAGADHGNERHAAVEGLHFGADVALYPSETRRMLALYASTLARHGLTPLPGMQERRVLISGLECVGTLDNIVEEWRDCPTCNGRGGTDGTYGGPCTDCLGGGRLPGSNAVADLKTQRQFWSFLEIGAQLACYAHGDAMWDPVAGRWVDMPKVRQDVALVLWMPRGATTVDVLEVDIVAGWKTARRAHEVVLDRSAAKSGRAWLRPAPPVTETEQYAALFAGVDSHAEGRALTEECRRKGLWSPMLADAAELALLRLGKNVVG